jgi:hypothetical protein
MTKGHDKYNEPTSDQMKWTGINEERMVTGGEGQVKGRSGEGN